MKYRKIILTLLGILLFLVLWFFTINCHSRKPVEIHKPHSSAILSKHDFIIFENSRLRDDAEFRAYVEEQVKGTDYLRIRYDGAVRLHRTYITRAWVFYKKKKCPLSIIGDAPDL